MPRKKAETAPVEAVKLEAEKRPVEKKTTRKSAAKKAPAKKAEPKVTVKVQFGGNEYDIDEITKSVTKAYKSSGEGAVKSVEIYVKPEDSAVYYVVNSEVTDKIDL